MDKFEIEEIFVGEAHPEGTLARMEKERQIAYILNRLNIRFEKHKMDFLKAVEKEIRDTLS